MEMDLDSISVKNIEDLPEDSDEDASGDDQIGCTGNFWQSLMRQKKKRDRRWLMYRYRQPGQGKRNARAPGLHLVHLYISTYGICIRRDPNIGTTQWPWLERPPAASSI